MLSEYESLNKAVSLYEDVITNLLNKHAPLVTKSFLPSRSPWWDKSCQAAKSTMRRAQRCYNKNKDNDEKKNEYKERLIDKAIVVNRARNFYYDNKLSLVKGDSKGTYGPFHIT